MISKLKSCLAEQLAKADGSELIDVVLELRPSEKSAAQTTGSRSERVAALKDAFTRAAAPVEETIRRLGGEVTGRAWINQLVRARVPAGGLEELCESDEVTAVDAPRRLEPDAS